MTPRQTNQSHLREMEGEGGNPARRQHRLGICEFNFIPGGAVYGFIVELL